MKKRRVGWAEVTCLLALAALSARAGVDDRSGPFTWQQIPVFTAEFFRTSGVTRIPLRVDTGELAYPPGFPVSGGVPVPRGELASLAHARVLDPATREIPSQLRALAFWPDMSVKWLLVEFRLCGTVPNPVCFLEYGREVEASVFAAPIGLVEDKDRLVVDTGTLKAEIGRRTGSLIDRLWVDSNRNGTYETSESALAAPVESYVHLRDALGDRDGLYSTLADLKSEYTVEKAGSEEVTVLVKAWHVDKGGRRSCPVDVRLTFYRGRDDVRIYHTFHVSEDGNSITFPSFGLRLPTGAVERFNAGVDGEPVSATGRSFSLYQDSLDSYWYPTMDQFDPHCVVSVNGESMQEGDKCDGWVHLVRANRGVTVSLVEAWQNYPKAFTYATGVLTMELWPYARDEPMCFRRFDQSLPPHYTVFQQGESRHLRGFEYELRCYRNRTEDWERMCGTGFGLAKSHDIMVSFAEKTAGDDDGADAARLAFRPLMPFVSGAWNSFTGAAGLFHPEDRLNFPRFEASWDKHVEALKKHQREWFNWYGLWHWGDFQSYYKGPGDRWGEGRWTNFDSKYGWRNGGMGIPFGFTLRYLRSGRREAWDMARQIVVKHMDVSSSHPRAWEEGRLVSHEQMNHARFPWVGGGVRYNSDGWGTIGYGYDSQHTWLIGIAQYFYLTGNYRARDVIEEYLEAVDRGCKFYNIKRHKGKFYPTHARTVDMTSAVAAVGYEIDPRNERNRELFDYMIWHQAKGMGSLKADERGVCYHTDINAAIGWYYTFYKGINIMYLLAVDPRPELVQAVLKGHPEAYSLTVPAGGAFHALCYRYGGNRNFAKMAARCVRYGGLWNREELGMADALPPWDYGYSMLENYYSQRATYAARLSTHPGALSSSARLGYATGARGPDNEPLGGLVRFVPVDLRAQFNDRPLGDVTPVAANEDFTAGPVRFDFGPLPRVEDGWLPADKRFYYPTTKRQRDLDQTFAAMPFGSTVRLADVDFVLPDPLLQTEALGTLKITGPVRIPISIKARRLYLLTGPAETREVYTQRAGLRYAVQRTNGTVITGELRNMVHYQSRHLRPRVIDERYYAGTPTTSHLAVVPIDCQGEEISELRLEPADGGSAGVILFAVTVGTPDPAIRTWTMRDMDLGASQARFNPESALVGGARRSNERIDYTAGVPNGDFLLILTLSTDLTGCPTAVFVNGAAAFSKSALAARTTYQVPVRISDRTLHIAIVPGELHTKSVNGVATVALHEVALADIPPHNYLPLLGAGDARRKKPLCYGWRLRGERAILRDGTTLDKKPMAHKYHPADNTVEDDSVYMITGGTMRGEFIVDDVPAGRYKVTLWMNTHGISSKADLQVEDAVFRNLPVRSAHNNPTSYHTTASIEKPFTCAVDVADGQLNVVVDASKENGHYVLGTWHVAGLQIERQVP